MKIFYKIVRAIINVIAIIFLKLFFRIKIVGKENIPKDGAYILCGNHVSNWDPIAIVVFTPREVCFMAKKELFKTKFMQFIAKVYGFFPVDRSGRDIDAIKTSLKILKDQKILGIFPEGTRKGLEKNNKVKNGAAYIALKSGAPVIPVFIKGDFKLFKKVVLSYGKPRSFKEYVSNNKAEEKENLEKISEIIINDIKSVNQI